MGDLFDNRLVRVAERRLARFGVDMREIAVFGVVGVSGTIVHYAVALASAQVVHILLANMVGYLAALSVSYIGHQRFTFRVPASAHRHALRLPRFIATTVTAAVASEAVLLVAHELGGLPSWAALLCAVATVPCITFVGYKYWVFADLPEPELDAERL